MCLDMYAIGHGEERGLPCMLETCTPYKPCIRFVEEIVRPCPCALEKVEKGGIKGVGFFGHTGWQ